MAGYFLINGLFLGLIGSTLFDLMKSSDTLMTLIIL